MIGLQLIYHKINNELAPDVNKEATQPDDCLPKVTWQSHETKTMNLLQNFLQDDDDYSDENSAQREANADSISHLVEFNPQLIAKCRTSIRAPIPAEGQVQITKQGCSPEVTWNGNKIEITDVVRNMLRKDDKYCSDKYLTLRDDVANIIDSLVKSHPALMAECRNQVQAEGQTPFTMFEIHET